MLRTLSLMLLVLAGPALAAPSPVFDAEAAWTEFEQTLREVYAYLDRDDFDVDAHLARTRAAALETRYAGEFRAVLHRSGFAFTDPHFLVVPLADDDPNVWPTSGDLAVGVDGDDYVIVDVRQGSAADEAGLRPGDRVGFISGLPVARMVAALWGDLLPAPTDAQRAYAATLLANGRRTGPRLLGVVRDGDRSEHDLSNPRALADAVAARAPVTVARRPEACVLRPENSLGRRETIAAFDAAITGCLDAPAVILDLRNTPSGGNTDVARSIIGHFIDEARPYQVHEIPAVERNTTVPRRFIELALPRAPHFAGPLVVLGGRWTGSMGEGLVIGLDAAADAHTITSDMGDLRGALHRFELPTSGLTLELGAQALFHVDGTPREAYVADTPLRSADRDAAGGDPALEAALAHLAGSGAAP